MNKSILIKEDESSYSNDDFSLKREIGFTPDRYPIMGRWVLRNREGNFLDFDQYRHDIAARHNLELKEK